MGSLATRCVGWTFDESPGGIPGWAVAILRISVTHVRTRMHVHGTIFSTRRRGAKVSCNFAVFPGDFGGFPGDFSA